MSISAPPIQYMWAVLGRASELRSKKTLSECRGIVLREVESDVLVALLNAVSPGI